MTANSSFFIVNLQILRSGDNQIPASRGGVSDGYRKIKCLQALAWWVTDLMLWDKIIDLNKFKTDILAEDIEESRLDFEDTRDRKEELSKPKQF